MQRIISCKCFTRFILCFIVVTVIVLLYIGFLLRTYNSAVASAQFDISFDIFERKQRIQQQKDLLSLKELQKTVTSTENIKADVKIAKVHNHTNKPLRAEESTHSISNTVRQVNTDQIPAQGMPRFEKGIDQYIKSNSKSVLYSPKNHYTQQNEYKGINSSLMNSQQANIGHLENGISQTTENSVHDDILSSGSYLLNFTENTDSGSGTYKALWVYSEGSLLERVKNYNVAINRLRKELVKARGDKPWQQLSGTMESFWCNRDDFHKELEKYPIIKTVSLAWHKKIHVNSNDHWESRSDTENLLLQKYYAWSGSENLCRWVHTAGFTRARWDAVYNRTCNTLHNLTYSNQEAYLEPLYLHGKPINKNHYWPHHGTSYPKYFYTSTPPQVLYMHVIEDAVVTKLGDVISGNFKLVPYSCSQDVGASAPPNFHFSPLYNEVFIMGQYWGDNFFHMMVENLPRIAPYLAFIKANPQILIHAQATDGYTARSLEILGLNRTRLIKGTIRALRVFLPQATPCGFAQLQNIQILSYYYRNHIHKISPLRKPNQHSILLIRRSGSRRFTQHLRIQEELEKLAKEFDLDFEMFVDNPSPPMETAMMMFNRAFLVVGPHGAGLSNLVYCEPGTLVIEGVCNPPHVNMCYQWTAHVLGLGYHGIGSRGGCETWVDVDYQEVAAAARELLTKSLSKS